MSTRSDLHSKPTNSGRTPGRYTPGAPSEGTLDELIDALIDELIDEPAPIAATKSWDVTGQRGGGMAWVGWCEWDGMSGMG